MTDDRAERAEMMAAIAEDARRTSDYTGRDSFDERVMAAVDSVPRHIFVPREYRTYAYENRPLPIGGGQTISQPYIVALMTGLAAVGPGQKVLEIGTGCGYQAAVLAELGAEVYSIERVHDLAERAAATLKAAGYARVHLSQGDGSKGWPEAAPFDAILVTAAASGDVPPSLLRQLVPGGRLVIPLERRSWLSGLGNEQELVLVVKDAAGKVSRKTILPVAFVPLIEGKASD